MTTAAIEQANGAVTNILQNDALNLDQKLAGIRDIVSKALRINKRVMLFF